MVQWPQTSACYSFCFGSVLVLFWWGGSVLGDVVGFGFGCRLPWGVEMWNTLRMVKVSEFPSPLELPDLPAEESELASESAEKSEGKGAGSKSKVTRTLPEVESSKGAAGSTRSVTAQDGFEAKVKSGVSSSSKFKDRLGPPVGKASTLGKSKGTFTSRTLPPLPDSIKKSSKPAPKPAPALPQKPRFYKVGSLIMSAEDIRTTILLVEEMEGVVIDSLKRGLESQKTPGGLMTGKDRESALTAPDPEPVTVPAPGGGTREILARSEEDTVDVVNNRFLSAEERGKLIRLVEKLPQGMKSEGAGKSKEVPTEFSSEMRKLLNGEDSIELYEIRTLVPVKESGLLSLKDYLQNDSGKRVKPEPHFEGTNSRMLREKAIRLGILKP